MKQNGGLADAKAVLLVGGLGTRLRTVVPSTPKALALVGNRPFLELLVRQLHGQGIRHVVMCTGYLADQIESEFVDGRDLGLTITYSKEPEPLGTAGALKFAQKHLEGVAEFFVMNGDSFLDVDLGQLVRFHRSHGGLATLATVPVEDAGRYGTVRIDGSGRVLEFCEKTSNNSPGLINAGVYVFDRSIFDHIPAGPVSLEKDVFPKILDSGVYSAEQQGLFIDIGTPVDYVRAQQLLDRVGRASEE